MNPEELEEAKELLKPHLSKVMRDNQLQMVFFMLTDILNESSELLCSAIVSDTLLFRSPTCTKLDENIARKLAKIAEIDLEELAMEMFNAGSILKGKSA